MNIVRTLFFSTRGVGRAKTAVARITRAPIADADYFYRGVQSALNGDQSVEISDQFGKELREKYTAAFNLLIESETGRFLVNRMLELGYTIEFNDEKLKNSDAGALCVSAQRKIILPTEADIPKIVRLMAHEMGHGYDISGVQIPCPALYDTVARLAYDQSLEANARVYELMVGLELCFHSEAPDITEGSPPIGQLILESFGSDYKSVLNEALAIMRQDLNFTPQIRLAIAEKAFREYFNLTSTRRSYEIYYMKNLVNGQGNVSIDTAKNNMHALADKLGYTFNEALAKRIRELITYCGTPYLPETLDLRDPYFSGMTLWTKRDMPEDAGVVLTTAKQQYFHDISNQSLIANVKAERVRMLADKFPGNIDYATKAFEISPCVDQLDRLVKLGVDVSNPKIQNDMVKILVEHMTANKFDETKLFKAEDAITLLMKNITNQDCIQKSLLHALENAPFIHWYDVRLVAIAMAEMTIKQLEYNQPVTQYDFNKKCYNRPLGINEINAERLKFIHKCVRERLREPLSEAETALVEANKDKLEFWLNDFNPVPFEGRTQQADYWNIERVQFDLGELKQGIGNYQMALKRA